MSSSVPPSVPYFNGLNYNSNFYLNPTDSLTQSDADLMYLKYPIAQGNQTMLASTFEDDIVMNKNPVASITATNELNITGGLLDDLNITSNNILTLSGNQTFVNTFEFINQGSYNQNVNQNSTNPTTITSATELMVCSTIGNNLTMLTYTDYYQGFMFKVANITNSVITLTSPDINFESWLRGNVGLVYNIQPNSAITCYLLIPSITLGVAEWFVRDDFGYKTINTTTNATHYLNFSDASASGVGNIQKTAGISCNPNTNTITASVFSGSATGVLTTSDNTSGTYYIPFSKTTAQANTSLFLDDTTGPLTYNPSSGSLNFLIAVCPRYDNTSNSASGTVFNNSTTGNTTYSNATTTGTISIGSVAMTTGNINIGSTTVTTGVVNIRPPLVLTNNVLRTNNLISPSNDLDLGKTFSYFGSNFVNTTLTGGIVANVITESFATNRYGTYLVTANVIISPTNTTAVRKCQISISTTLGTIQSPYFVQTYSAIGGNVETLYITRVIPIYTATTVVLTALCDTGATIATGVTDNLFTFTRIA